MGRSGRPAGRFGRILCPVDFSSQSRAALRYAAAAAAGRGGRLTVLFVDDPLLAAAAAAAHDPRLQARTAIAELGRFVAPTIRAAGLPAARVRLLVAVGDPAGEIVKTARRARADLIVMGTHGLSGFQKLMLGSVTGRVLKTAPLPVLAVPPRTGRTRSQRV